MKEKICKICGVNPVEFHKQMCGPCRDVRIVQSSSISRKKNFEHYKQYYRQYAKNHREQCVQKVTRSYKKHREKRNLYHTRYQFMRREIKRGNHVIWWIEQDIRL